MDVLVIARHAERHSNRADAAIRALGEALDGEVAAEPGETAADRSLFESERDFRRARIAEAAAAKRDVRLPRVLLDRPVRNSLDVERRAAVDRRERFDR